MSTKMIPNVCGDNAVFVPAVPCGQDCELQEGSATSNGLLLPEEGYDGFSSVDVNVPNTYDVLDEGKVVQSGALVAQTARTISEVGTFDTTTNNSITVSFPLYDDVGF